MNLHKNQKWLFGRNFSCLLIVIIISTFHLGLIKRKDDPILKTQTDPILFKKKMEEIKDGEKGPSMPTVIHYKKSDFLMKDAVQQDEKGIMDENSEEESKEDSTLNESSEDLWWLEEDDSEQDNQNVFKESSDFDDLAEEELPEEEEEESFE